ncbi:coiled-coil domain-containing protein 9B [Pholidichthys leucotaenia]
MMPKRDHEKDLELDKKIEALRRKNEALMKRYKEVEEDRKRAEEEGMALQCRKGKADDLTITISKSTSDGRVVVTKPFSSGSPTGKGQQEMGSDTAGEGQPSQGAGRGHRKQLTVTMAGKKGKRVVSERPEKRPIPADTKNPYDDGQARRAESAGRGKQLSHMAKRDTAPQDEVKQGQKHPEEQHGVSESCQEPENQQATTDLNVPTSREEQEEYLRWKKEREQIDRERVARHKNAKGQWRRAWDMDKTENMFENKSLPDRDWGPSSRGGRNIRRGQSRGSGDSKGHDKKGKDKAAKNALVTSSKAKGKDRLTGRARRWQPNDEENPQTLDTTLEEFLEELDALTSTDSDNLKDQDSKTKTSPSLDLLSKTEEVSESAASSSREDTPTQKKAEEVSSLWGSEKKVRFSEDLIQGTTNPPGSSSLKTSSSKKNKPEVKETIESAKQYEGCSDAPLVSQQQIPESECTITDSQPPAVPSCPPAEKACAPLQEAVEQHKYSNMNTEELIDSGLSVLSLDSGETHPTHSTSSDKAREHGKIV